MADPVLVLSLTPEQLRTMIADAVRDALGDAMRPASTWIDETEAANLLGYSVGYLPAAVRRYAIPHARAGRHYRFRRAELEEWLRDRSGATL